MTEIERVDLWELFVGTQNLQRGMQPEGDYIIFRVRYPGDAKTILRHSIKRSDLEDIEDIFNDVSWSSVPLPDYLLWILWVREEKFDMRSPLKESDKFNSDNSSFVQRSFALINRNIKAETVEGVFGILLQGGYLEKWSVDWQASDNLYSLTSRGKRIAKRMFQKTTKGNFAYDKPQSVAQKTESDVPLESVVQTVVERRTKGKTSLSREALEGRRLAAVKYATQYPEASLDSIERRFGLGEKTLSRKPYKDMIAKYARDIKGAPKRGKRTSVLGKKEKATRSASDRIPDYRKSHEDEVDERLDGFGET